MTRGFSQRTSPLYVNTGSIINTVFFSIAVGIFGVSTMFTGSSSNYISLISLILTFASLMISERR